MSNSCLRKVEDHWKLKTDIANNLFSEGKYKNALEVYKIALYKAEVLNIQNSKCSNIGIPFLQINMTSYNNLANAYEELGKAKKAIKILKSSIYYLLNTAKNNISNFNEVQNELKRAVMNYFELKERLGLQVYKSQDEQLLLSLRSCLSAN